MEHVECMNHEGKDDHILVFHVEPSSKIHSTTADEVYLRIGDKSHRLNFEERMQLIYSKGSRYYEDELVADSCIAETLIA